MVTSEPELYNKIKAAKQVTESYHHCKFIFLLVAKLFVFYFLVLIFVLKHSTQQRCQELGLIVT